VNHFLDRLEKRLQFEVAIVPLADGVADGLCVISPKGTRRNPDAAGADLLGGASKQQVARFMQRATQMQQLGGVSIILLFQVP
jgi:hypothetical protein